MAIGIFDGVHRGHQAILRTAQKEARRLRAAPAALTFPAHPSRVLNPGRPVPLLQSFEQRCDWIRRYGINWIFPLHFTKSLSKLTPAEFVYRLLFRKWNLRGVVVGRDFRFGHRRAGTVRTLRDLLARRDAQVFSVDPVRCGGGVAQSTAVRRLLQAGRLPDAVRMLGHPFELAGRVVKGAGMGRRLGARTINLRLESNLMPRHGVYAGWLRPARGSKRPIVMNLGVAPTVHRGRGVRLETHVLDGRPVGFRPGIRLTVEVARFLRPERKFSSLAALRRAIQRDIRRAKKEMRNKRD